MKTYRQGDILLIEINALPEDAHKQATQNKIVLGEGEIAGHRHEITETDKVDAYREAEGFYLSVAEETALIHPEHQRLALDPGTYEVIHQVEFQRKELQRVQD